MNSLKKLFQYLLVGRGINRALIVKAFFYCAWVRFLMLFVKYSRYEKSLGERGKKVEYAVSEQEFAVVRKIQAAVEGVSKHTLWESKCMVQAVSTKWLLQKHNIPSTIYFGIMKDLENQSELKAHAWLKIGDWVVTGRHGHQSFKVVNFYS